MNAAQLVAEYLADRTAISALVDDHVYWAETPATISVANIRVSLINGNRLHNLPYAHPDVQVSAFAKNKADVEELKEAIIDEMRDGRLVMGTTCVTSVYQDDRTFKENSWWHSPITFGLRFQED